jgi:outer membrane murein-binding lipoprotein Lpp
MLKKLCTHVTLVAVFVAGLTLAGCASNGKQAQPQMMSGDAPAPAHERHASGIDSHVRQR